MIRDSGIKKELARVQMYFVYLTVFLTGAAVLVLEILGTRVLSPYFGVSLYIWSALITVTLTALALGYWLGGLLADRGPSIKKLYLLIFLAGVFILIIPLASPILLKILSHLGIRTGVLCSAAVLFGPSLFLLAMVTPYAVKLATPELNVLGRRVGCLYAVSTAGGCFGAIVTGFILIPNFGVARVFYLLSLVMFLLWAMQFVVEKGRTAVFVVLPLLILVFFLSLKLSAPASRFTASTGTSLVYEADSLYGQLKVVDKGHTRWLLIDNAPNSGIDKQTGFPIYKYTYYLERMNYIHPEARDALVIGLGGGCIAKRFTDRGIRTDAVEIDGKVAAVARNYFNFDPGKGNIHIQDGRRYVRTSSRKYDLAVIDVANGDIASFHMFSRESLNEISLILKDGGVLGINFLGFGTGKDSRAARSVFRTLNETYNHVEAYLQNPGGFGNIIFFASDRPLTLRRKTGACPTPEIRKILAEMPGRRIDYSADGTTGIVLTDDHNPLQEWSLKAAAQWRRNIWKTSPVLM